MAQTLDKEKTRKKILWKAVHSAECIRIVSVPDSKYILDFSWTSSAVSRNQHIQWKFKIFFFSLLVTVNTALGLHGIDLIN